MYFDGERENGSEETESRAEQWRLYMQTKKAKLQQQVNENTKQDAVSNIFEGVSIYVNGYTDPPAAKLRYLIQLHGGEYHIYYKHGTTTHTIATHVALSKARKLRKEEKIVHPKWLTDSIKAGTRLREDDYLLYENQGVPTAVSKSFDSMSNNGRKTRNAATDPNFVSNFYERSRLHLISTLAQEMKQFVANLREEDIKNFTSRFRLQHLIDENMQRPPNETVCHIDLDCFFVSVALRTRPELIGKPVAITHSKGNDYGAGMSEVASCSYEARAQGVHNGCFVRDAKKSCPDLICLPYQFEDYRQVSKHIYSIVSRYTLDIRSVSCDEMYIDLQSLCEEMRIVDVMGVISVIRNEILAETGCIASVGIGTSLLMARIATRHAKPNGQFLIEERDVDDFMKKEKISALPGIGYGIYNKLQEVFGEMELCEKLQTVPLNKLQSLFGTKTGVQIYNLCRGVDKRREFLDKTVRKSVSCDINYGIRFSQEKDLMEFLGKIAVELEKKLAKIQMSASGVTLRLLIRAQEAPIETEKFLGCGKCDAITRTSRLSETTADASVIHMEAVKLMKSVDPIISDLRGINRRFCERRAAKQAHYMEKILYFSRSASAILNDKDLQIGIRLTHLRRTPYSQMKDTKRKTLTQFFSVRSKGQRYNRKEKPNSDAHAEHADFDFALKASCMESQNKRSRIRTLDYRNYVEDRDVKAELLRLLREPENATADQVVELATYFCMMSRNGDLSNVVSQLRYIERLAIENSFEWTVTIVAIKNAVNYVSRRFHGHEMFL